jgi:hypothetical protein
MPPRFAYWTILAGGLPTAFRAADRDDLLPTFKRIQEKHPDAEMKWFARGRLWASPDEAREHAARGKSSERRDRSWRPGGDHRDRRDAHKAAARARNQAHRRDRFARKQRAPAGDQTPTRPAGPASQHRASKPPSQHQRDRKRPSSTARPQRKRRP